MTICERMFYLIEKSGGTLKQAELCRILGITSSTMSTWKRTGKDPDAKYIARICEYLDCSLEYLLTGQKTEKPVPLVLSENGRAMLKLYETLSERDQLLMLGRLQELADPLRLDQQAKEAYQMSGRGVG